jgi:hypothetical protein
VQAAGREGGQGCAGGGRGRRNDGEVERGRGQSGGDYGLCRKEQEGFFFKIAYASSNSIQREYVEYLRSNLNCDIHCIVLKRDFTSNIYQST